ncbi:MAG TPA: hypothetical protein PKI11_08450 [Candidatus Hydrogenedentes bacterium]|nr:hypothetical protein [Candidatus Hydrogenedentota bacterium]
MHIATSASFERRLLRDARDYPILECFVNKEWREQGIANVVVARAQSEHLTLFGVFLVDLGCLGVKNAFCNVSVTRSDYGEFKENFREGNEGLSICSVSLAHEIVYGGLDYAKAIGFRPHKDFALAQLILEPREAITFDNGVEFGKDGKPFYCSGPNDNVDRIMNHLTKTLGPDNFHYIVHVATEDFEYEIDDELGETEE